MQNRNIQQLQQIRQVPRVTQKTAKTKSHIEFLERCIDENIISRGHRLKWSPSYIVNGNEVEMINKIMFQASYRLMDESVDHNKRHLKTLMQKHQRAWTETTKSTTEQELLTIKQQMDYEYNNMERRMKTKKTEN